MEYREVLSTMSSILDSLYESDVLGHRIKFGEEVVIIGKDAELDSLAFVTFIADLEQKLGTQIGQEIVISITDMQDFDVTNPFISVRKLADYIVSITG